MHIIFFGDCIQNGNYHFHSGFDNIDNFINQNNEFISIASNDSYLAPNCVVIDDFISGRYREISINNEQLIINNINHTLYKALEYNTNFIYPDISTKALKDRIEIFLQINQNNFAQKSLFFLLNPKNEEFFNSAFEKAYKNQMKYAFSIFKTNIIDSITEFKSRGGGLTPSGDDFIAGILFALDFFIINKNSEFKDLIFQKALSNNVFSNNYLRFAYQSKYFKRFKDFLLAFFSENQNDINIAFAQMTAIGDTSGSDLLTGFFSTLLLYDIDDFKEY